MENTSIINKIKDLLRLAKSSNEHEATNAAVMANKLIQKHRINIAQLDDVSNKTFIDHKLHSTARVITWKQNLFCVLAKHYGCFSWLTADYSTGRKNTSFMITGTSGDIEIVDYMFHWLTLKIESLIKTLYYGNGHIICNSFALGMVNGINAQLNLSKEESKKDLAADGVDVGAAMIMLDNRQKEAEKNIMARMNLKQSTTSSNSRIDSSAYSSGYNKGKSLQLNKGLKS